MYSPGVPKFGENDRNIGLVSTHLAGDARVQGRSITELDLANVGVWKVL
jgi:hypothetical protein